MSKLAADGIPVAVTCRVLKLARQPYCRWLANPVTESELILAYRANVLFDARDDDPEFGHRFLADEAADAGQVMAERTAWRICSTNSWFSMFGMKPKRGKGRNVGPPVHYNLVQRDFTAAGVDELCLGASPMHRTMQGRFYVHAIKDIFSKYIVGYSIESRMKFSIAINALNSAVARREDVAGCVLQSDCESQFLSTKHVRALVRYSMVGAIDRVRAASDNAATESFFSLLQKNVLDRQIWLTREDLRIVIII